MEHVINVLGRLNAAPVPPMANTARYDSLRSQSSGEAIDGDSGLTGAGSGPTEEASHA